MAPKSKAKSKAKGKAKSKTIAKPKKAAKSKVKSVRKPVAKSRPAKKTKTRVQASARMKAAPVRTVPARAVGRTSINFSAKPAHISRPITPVVKRAAKHLVDRRPALARAPRIHQFTYMKAPGIEHAFEAGDIVEAFGDHEKNRERVRGWVRGTVVQVDNKMVAVQFRSNIYLTDGWMVPDRILWYPVNSEHIRPVPGKKAIKKDFIPDY